MKIETEYTMERLTEMLQQKDIRPTAQRIAVLSVVANGRSHPSAEEIYGSLSELFRSLSRTTVYNSLGILVATVTSYAGNVRAYMISLCRTEWSKGSHRSLRFMPSTLHSAVSVRNA